MLNSDDCFEPTRIDEMVEAVAATDADWGFSAVSCIDASGVPVKDTDGCARGLDRRGRGPDPRKRHGRFGAPGREQCRGLHRQSFLFQETLRPPRRIRQPSLQPRLGFLLARALALRALLRAPAPVPLPRPREQHDQGTELRDPAGSFEHAVRLPFGRIDPAADQSAGAVPPQPRHSLRRAPPRDGRR